MIIDELKECCMKCKKPDLYLNPGYMVYDKDEGFEYKYHIFCSHQYICEEYNRKDTDDKT